MSVPTDTELDRLLEELSPDNPFFPGQDSLKAQVKQLVLEARLDEAEKACAVMRNHSDDIILAQRVVLERIAALQAQADKGEQE